MGNRKSAMPSGETSSGLAVDRWRTADGCGNWLNSRGSAEIFAREISHDFIDFIVLRDALQLIPRLRAANARETLETRATRFVVFRPSKNLGRRCRRIATRFGTVLRDEANRSPHVTKIPRDIDVSARLRDLLEETGVILEPARDIEPILHVVRQLFAVDVLTKTQNIQHVERETRLGVVFERRQLGATISFELRGESVRIFSVSDEGVVLFGGDLRFGVQAILKRIECDSLETATHFGTKLRIQRRVQREQQLQLRIRVQTRRLIDVHATTSGHEVVYRAAEKERQVPKLRKRQHIARYVVQHAARHLAFLRIV